MRTIQNYMKVAMEIPKTQLIAFLDRLPTQTYRMLGVVKPPKPRVEKTVQTLETEKPTIRPSETTPPPPQPPPLETWEAKCPHCHRAILVDAAHRTVEPLAEEEVPTEWEDVEEAGGG